MLADEPRQLAHDLGVTAERQVDPHAQLQARQAQPFETGDLVAGERLELEIGKRSAAPETERLAEHLTRLEGGTLGLQTAALIEQPLEPLEVEGALGESQQIPRRPRLERVLTEQLP